MNGRVATLLTLALMITAGTLLLSSTPSHAETQFGIAGFAGYNSYAMGDANDLIDTIDDALEGTGYDMDEISSGWGFGGGLRVKPSPKFLLAFDYERLNASSELEIFDSGFELDVPANAFTGTAVYLFPSASKAQFGLGAGVGYYKSSGSAGFDSSGVSIEADVEGSGVGFHGAGFADFAISPVVHLEAMAGYRLAETGEVEIAGDTAFNAEGDEATLDWGGFMSRVGLSFYFGGGTASP